MRQKFTYHSHTNSLGVFDGCHSADEMMSKAENLGFEEIGISNHLMCHPNIGEVDKYGHMYFRDYEIGRDIYKRTVDDVRNAAAKHKIKTLVGFEVDFFDEPSWIDFFSGLKEDLDADYFIGASHFVFEKDYSKIYKIASVRNLPSHIQQEMTDNHWRNLSEAVKTGWFSFIAHLDQIKIKKLDCQCENTLPQQELIRIIIEHKHPVEVSTKGFRKIGEPFPSSKIIKELIKNEVPLLVSDDAHHIDQVGENFDVVETLLSDIGCQKRFRF